MEPNMSKSSWRNCIRELPTTENIPLQLPGLGNSLLNSPNAVEGVLGQRIVLAVKYGLAALDSVLEAYILPWDTSPGFGAGNWLSQKAMQTTGANGQDFIRFAGVEMEEPGESMQLYRMMQFVIPSQQPLRLRCHVDMGFAKQLGPQECGVGSEQVNTGIQPLFGPLAVKG